MKIPQEIQAFFEQVPVMALSTADEMGIPNVSAIASKIIMDDETIWTIDTGHHKTLQNIEKNGNVALAFWSGSVGYQIKGKAVHHTKGEIFEKGKKWILSLKPQKIVKGVIEIKINNIYYLTPNYDLAGKEI